MTLEWKDETSYSRNQTDRTPRIWSLDVNGIKIKVHKYVGCGDLWLISCHELGIDMMDSKSEDVGEAKKAAIDFVAYRLRQVAKRYQETACILKECGEQP